MILSICLVSCTRQGMVSTTALQYFSTNKDKFSVCLPQLDVITRAGLPGLKAVFQSSHEAPRSSLRVLASN
jgi:hypothetical protein